MRLECITIEKLPAFLTSARFKEMPVIPISQKRGYAHSKNPRALPTDVALLLAYLDDKMVGYLGFVPDTIFNGSNQLHLAWMSCIWVDPNTRGKGVAKTMLKKGFEVWNYKLLATEFTAPAKRLYDKLALFDDLTVKHGLRCYLRFNLATLIPASRPKFSRIKPLLKVGDAILNMVNSFRLSFYSKKAGKDFSIESTNILDQACFDFIKQKQPSEFLQRKNIDLEWLLKKPWLGNSPMDKEDSDRYHFSIYAEAFQFTILKIKNGEKLIAVTILSSRDKHLKIPYCWVEDGFEKKVVSAIWKYMLEQSMNMLTVYQEVLIPFFKSENAPFYLKRPFDRHYLISKSIDKKNIPNEVIIQDGDGDCAFT